MNIYYFLEVSTMPNNFSDDYNRFIGKYITIVYEYGSKSKKLHCKLIEYYKNNLGGKFVVLEAYKNLIYHINCDNIIYLIAEYEDIYESDTKPMFVNTNIQTEELPFKQSQDIKASYKENTSVNSNDSTNNDQIQENNIIHSENKINPDTSQVSIDNPTIISDEHSINYIITDNDLNPDKLVTDHKDICDCDNVLEKYEKKVNYNENYLSSPLAVFINRAFHGVYLTIYTTSSQAISGEVIFNYNHLIALKSDTITYYINPEQIEYFY